MTLISLPHFGILDPASLEEYYDTEIDFNGTTIQVDLNFYDKTIDSGRLEKVKAFIENIRIHDINNRKYIDNDYRDEDGDTVKTYLEHHIDELGETELAGLVKPGTKSTEYEKELLKKIHLVRVGIYPDSDEQFAVFDYSLGKDITGYLVVVNTDENGNLDYITMES